MEKINNVYSNQQKTIEQISKRETVLKIHDFFDMDNKENSQNIRKAIVCTSPQEKDLLAIALDRLGLVPKFENVGTFRCKYVKNGKMNQAIKNANVFDNLGNCYMFLDTTIGLDNIYTFGQIDFENVLKPSEIKKIDAILSK